MPLRSALALAVLFVVLGVASCAGPPPPPPPPPAPGPISTAPPAPLPRAADGDNLAACAGGSCVVRIKASSVIPLNPQLTALNIRVEEITPDQVNFAIDTTSINIHAWGCSLSLTNSTPPAPALLRTHCPSGGKVIFDKMAMGVVAISQDVAIIRVIPL
jgi:hypothetical protein